MREVIGVAIDADTSPMTPQLIDRNKQDLVSEPLGVITPEQLAEIQQDPRLASFLERADQYLADLEEQGRSL